MATVPLTPTGQLFPPTGAIQPRRITPGLTTVTGIELGFKQGEASAGAETFVNRVFDTVAADFVRWSTSPSPDPSGTSYPGPGTFGVNTRDYAVESIQ